MNDFKIGDRVRFGSKYPKGNSIQMTGTIHAIKGSKRKPWASIDADGITDRRWIRDLDQLTLVAPSASIPTSTTEQMEDEYIVTAEMMGVVPSAPDMWCAAIMYLIENDTLAAAGYGLVQLVDYALKTQHSDQFNREVRDCVHAFWNRCERED